MSDEAQGEVLATTLEASLDGIADYDASPIRFAIDAMGPQQIEALRNEIIAAAAGDYEKLTSIQLHQLAYIASKLRKTSVGPPKEPKARKSGAKKTIDDLI